MRSLPNGSDSGAPEHSSSQTRFFSSQLNTQKNKWICVRTSLNHPRKKSTTSHKDALTLRHTKGPVCSMNMKMEVLQRLRRPTQCACVWISLTFHQKNQWVTQFHIYEKPSSIVLFIHVKKMREEQRLLQIQCLFFIGEYCVQLRAVNSGNITHSPTASLTKKKHDRAWYSILGLFHVSPQTSLLTFCKRKSQNKKKKNETVGTKELWRFIQRNKIRLGLCSVWWLLCAAKVCLCSKHHPVHLSFYAPLNSSCFSLWKTKGVASKKVLHSFFFISVIVAWSHNRLLFFCLFPFAVHSQFARINRENSNHTSAKPSSKVYPHTFSLLKRNLNQFSPTFFARSPLLLHTSAKQQHKTFTMHFFWWVMSQ